MAPTDASYLCNGTVPIRSGEHFSILNTALSRNSPRRLDREEWSRAPTVGKYFFLYDAPKKNSSGGAQASMHERGKPVGYTG